MQQQFKPTANQQMVQPFAPKKKAINKTVLPVTPEKKQKFNAGVTPDRNPLTGVNSSTGNYTQYQKQPYIPKQPEMSTSNAGAASPNQTPNVTKQNESSLTGLMGEAAKSYNTTASAGQDATTNASNIPQTAFTPNEYVSDGYTGVQGNTDFEYDPRDESLVQNQITGLLDPESALMRKAIAQANGYSASRGLQSSSIANGVALSTMVDKALPIAQQDANTFATADQTGWQNSFTAEQNNLNRSHEASMFDKQGQLQVDLQNNQYSYQNSQSNADRIQQYEMQQLQHKQNLGTLDKQAEIQQKRDELMNQFDSMKMDKNYLQDLEKTKLTWEHDDAVFTRNLDGQVALEYKNASADAYNKYLEQVAMIFSNPNMTPAQQNAGANHLKNMFESQRQQMQIIYGVANEANPSGLDKWMGPGDNDMGPIQYPISNNPIPQAATGGTSSGGSGGGSPGGGRIGISQNMR